MGYQRRIFDFGSEKKSFFKVAQNVEKITLSNFGKILFFRPPHALSSLALTSAPLLTERKKRKFQSNRIVPSCIRKQNKKGKRSRKECKKVNFSIETVRKGIIQWAPNHTQWILATIYQSKWISFTWKSFFFCCPIVFRPVDYINRFCSL